MSTPTSQLIGDDSRIPQGASHYYECTLEDRGVPIQVSAITDIRGWLDNNAGTIINGRNNVNLLNANGGTLVDAGGGVALFTWNLEPADAAIVDSAKTIERHRIKLTFTYARSGLSAGVLPHRVLYDVESFNLP